MKILQMYQNFLTYVIVRDESTANIPILSSMVKVPDFIQKNFVTLKNLWVYLMMVSGVFCLLVFLSNDAQTFQEFSETIYAISTLICCFVVIRIFEVNKTHIFALIDNFEKTIDTRKKHFNILIYYIINNNMT